MLLTNMAAGDVSPEYDNRTRQFLVVLNRGDGTVHLEIQAEDGSWASYAETRFAADTANEVVLPYCRWRLRVEGGTSTTVEVRR